jgi:hypothetical protein
MFDPAGNLFAETIQVFPGISYLIGIQKQHFEDSKGFRRYVQENGIKGQIYITYYKS